MTTSKHLEGKGVVVTGAGRGIGREIALAVARAGGKVIVNDLDREVAILFGPSEDSPSASGIAKPELFRRPNSTPPSRFSQGGALERKQLAEVVAQGVRSRQQSPAAIDRARASMAPNLLRSQIRLAS